MERLKLDNDESLRRSYKNIIFNYNSNHHLFNFDDNHSNQKIYIKPMVSFNTVPSILDTSSYDSTFNGLPLPIPSINNDFQILNKNFDNLNSLSFQSYNNIDKIFHLTPEGKLVRKDYPSRPTIVNDSIIINRHYLNWSDSWKSHKLQIEQRMNLSQSSFFKYPNIIIPSSNPKPIIMNEDYIPLTRKQRKKLTVINSNIPLINSPRTIICHLNGRKHTWVPLDWLLELALHDLDHLIILTNVPRMLHHIDPSTKKTSYNKNKNNNNNNNNNRGKSCWSDSLIYNKNWILETCYNILTYIYFLLSNRKPTIRIKITVDLVIGKTKKILIDSINLYTPDIIIVPTLKWERDSKLVDVKSTYLKDILCVKFPIPIIVVPVKRLFQFELNLQQRLNAGNQFQTIRHGSSRSDTAFVSSSSQSSFLTSDESLQSVDSFTTDHHYYFNHGGMATIPSNNNLSLCSSSKDSSDELDALNKEQFLIDTQRLPITSRLFLVAKKYRKNMQEEILQVEDNKNNLTRSEYLIQRLDCVLNNSLRGSLMINNFKDYEVSDSVDLKGFARLKRVLTGGEPVSYLSPRPMTDVTNYKSKNNNENNKGQVVNDDTRVKRKSTSQIMFASDVKIQDGKKALGNLKTSRSFSNSGKPITGATLKEEGSINHDNSILRKVYSNDSSKSTRSIKSDNILLYPKKTSIFKSKKKSKSTPSSRRNSDSSGKSQITTSLNSSSSSSTFGGKRKLISKLFGFK